MRIVEGRMVGDGVRIEDHDIGVAAGVETPAILQLEVLRRQARHTANRILERGDFLIAHVAAEEPGEIAVSARMRVALEERPSVAGASASEPRLTQGCDKPSVTFSSDIRKYAVANTRAIFDHQVDRRFFGRWPRSFATSASVLPVSGFSLSFLKPIRSTRSAEPGGAGADSPSQRAGVAHLLQDALAHRRILQTLRSRRRAAFLHPRRHRGIEAGGASSVGVHVGRDRAVRSPRRLDLRDRLHASWASSSGPPPSGDTPPQCTFASRAMRISSSSASSSRSPSLRMCEM